MVRLRARGPSQVRAAQARALGLLPASGAVEAFSDAVSVAQGRRICLLPFGLNADEPTGLWIATAEADYVVYPADATAAERTAIICHELAHILLGHQPAGDTAKLAQMAALVAPDIDPLVARQMLARHGYADDVEAEAEAFGTLLVTHLARLAARHSVAQDAVSDRLR
jgi:hypothetical protein